MMWNRDPWYDLLRFEDSLNTIFEDFLGKGNPLENETCQLPCGDKDLAPVKEGDVVWKPYTDIQETEKEVVLIADIPGVKKEDIKVNVTEEGVEIKAEKEFEKDEEKEGYIRRERSYSSFYRNYGLPARVDPKKAKAKYENGVLELTLTKKAEGKKGATINVE